MRHGVSVPLASVVLCLVALAPCPPAAGEEQVGGWMRQFGTLAPDDAEDVTVDGDGNVYVVGQTSGTLPGQTSAGTVDAFVRKYDAGGHELWTRQFGSFERDFAKGVAVDPAGEVYVAGQTFGTLPGQTSAGGFDAFVRKYRAGGEELWTRQFGSGGGEGAVSVAVDGLGRAHVAGSSRAALPGQASAGEYDPFVRTYDPNGAELWTRQFGGPEDDFAVDVAVDPGGAAVITGQTSGAVSGQPSSGQLDAFLRRYDAEGGEEWTRQFGSPFDDRSLSVILDGAGDSYVAGTTNGTFSGQVSAGIGDAFLRKYDRFGTEVWGRQFGTSSSDDAASVAVDGAGDLYVAGRTEGAFPGQVSSGDFDAYIRKQDSAGRHLWTRQFGTPEGDYALAVALDRAGVAHAVGGTLGALDGQAPSGGRDAFVVKLHAEGASAPLPPSGSSGPNAARVVEISASNFRFCLQAPCEAGDQAYVRTDSGSLADNPANFVEVHPGDIVVWTYEDSSCDGLVAGPVTCPGHEVQFETGQEARGTVGTMPARQGTVSVTWRVPARAQPGALYRYYCDLSDHWRLGVTGGLIVK